MAAVDDETPPPDEPDNYLGRWLTVMGKSRKEVHQKAGIGRSFLSQIISNKKRPSIGTALKISEAAGITVNQMYRPPPPAAMFERARTMELTQVARLAELIAETESRH